jgi:hypothetical protein
MAQGARPSEPLGRAGGAARAAGAQGRPRGPPGARAGRACGGRRKGRGRRGEREGEGRGAHLGVQIRRSPSLKPRAQRGRERGGGEEVAAWEN